MDLPQNHLFLSLEIFFIKVFYEGFDCLHGPLAPSSTDTDLVMRLKMFSHRGRCFEQIRLKNETVPVTKIFQVINKCFDTVNRSA